MSGAIKGLRERLKNGETIICAEGYVFEFERKGYLKAGVFVPEVVLEHPEMVKAMYEEFVHAGSDVVLAFTYYAHREKMRHVDKADMVETLNRKALKMAREVADKTGTLMAGNLCNSCVFNKDDPESFEVVRKMYKEQVEWAVEEGADFIVAETIANLAEAKLALEAIQRYGKGVPSVITLMLTKTSYLPEDGIHIGEALNALKDAGADVVGLNCHRGPKSMVQSLKEIQQTYKGPLAALPVCYRTNDKCPNFASLLDEETGLPASPVDLDAHFCSRSQIHEFGLRCKELGIQYVGLCCGNCAHYTRTLAESLGRTPPGSRFSPDMTQHYIFGNDKKLPKHNSKVRELVGVKQI